MINGFLDNGQQSEAKNILSRMVKEIAQWDHVSYVSVLGLCADSKDPKFGGQIHGQILRRGMEYNDFVCSAIVDMYGKCSDVQNAVLAFHELPGKNVVSWTAVMASCTQNGHFEESLKLFIQMADDGVRANGLTYAVALNSCAEIKLIGYVPNIACASHDVEDEQKEEYLRYHSEKLAIAFGVIHMPPGAAIYIMKNLRMCDDCHVAVKLISIVTNRKLVVRDANRFHCFESGCCSCDDYW
ncbi:PPR repeat [Musa troglodytarum]|uniref:PPR repeat n=1 Tax=Musa troglodytarum TaxID=320322 RepID=A0A9E7F5T2_9LILI|nr:PPR repeat [Musa troglodytarum]